MIAELARQAQFSGTALQAQHFLLDNPRMISSLARGAVGSLYIDPDGTVHVLRPHTHDDIARKVLRNTTDLNVPDESTGDDEWIQTFLQMSGVIHAQVHESGFGVTIDLTHGPTREQIVAVDDLDVTTGGRFSAYVNLNGKPVGHFTTVDSLLHAIYRYVP